MPILYVIIFIPQKSVKNQINAKINLIQELNKMKCFGRWWGEFIKSYSQNFSLEIFQWKILLYFLYLKEAPPIPSRAKDGTTTYAFSRQHSTRSTRLREKTGAGQGIIPQMNDDRWKNWFFTLFCGIKIITYKIGIEKEHYLLQNVSCLKLRTEVE